MVEIQEKLDLTDRKIVYALDFASRMSLTQLGKKVGISKEVAKYRLDNLVKKGIIKGFYTDINASTRNNSLIKSSIVKLLNADI